MFANKKYFSKMVKKQRVLVNSFLTIVNEDSFKVKILILKGV